MKKSAHILFILAYLLPTIGLTVAHHFCGDTLVSTKVVMTSEVKEPVDCCGEEPEGDPCCTNRIVSYKLDDFHFASAKITVDESISYLVLIPAKSICNTEAAKNLMTTSHTSESPPGNPAYIINCTLLV
ncbi:MAG: hypothetical protein HYZ10_05435 [Ignavibacteriales bacterium]|nr:hypothetical protein [Ignavibacteriales bacterium]